MTKEELIKEAWGLLPIKILNKVIKNNGWLYFGYACNGWDDVEDYLCGVGCNSNRDNYDMISDQCDNGDLIGIQIRPKSLQGIENNNGWIKIECEEDLPKEVIECRTCFYNGKNYIEGVIKKRSPQELSRLKYINEITHYKPIEKPKPPIY